MAFLALPYPTILPSHFWNNLSEMYAGFTDNQTCKVLVVSKYIITLLETQELWSGLKSLNKNNVFPTVLFFQIYVTRNLKCAFDKST